MLKWRVTHDFSKSQPRTLAPLFGPRNEGFVITGSTQLEAFQTWQAGQTPGTRLNPFYLKFTQES
jgi:hypothetical protein